MIQQLPSSQGLQVVAYIARVISGAGQGIGETPTRLDFDQTPFNIGGVMSGMLDRLDEEATPSFIKKLVLSSVVPEMSAVEYENNFAGNYDELWELVDKIIEHNGFVEVLKKRLSAIMEMLSAEEAGKPPAKSTRSTKRRSSPS